jgi:hypothetical protein
MTLAWKLSKETSKGGRQHNALTFNFANRAARNSLCWLPRCGDRQIENAFVGGTYVDNKGSHLLAEEHFVRLRNMHSRRSVSFGRSFQIGVAHAVQIAASLVERNSVEHPWLLSL